MPVQSCAIILGLVYPGAFQSGQCVHKQTFVFISCGAHLFLGYPFRLLTGEPPGPDDIVSVTESLFWADDT